MHYQDLVLQLYRGVWEETQRRMARAHAAPPSMHSASWTHAVRARWHALVSDGAPTSHAPTEPSIAHVLARRLVLRHWLLVFDEVQLLDVSSAGLLADVLGAFWRLGGVVVGTSNAVPEDLYRHGTARARLAPFLAALAARCPVLEMRARTDYRAARAAVDAGVGATWFGPGQEAEFEQALARLAEGEPRTVMLPVF
jgi:protein AFG1